MQNMAGDLLDYPQSFRGVVPFVLSAVVVLAMSLPGVRLWLPGPDVR